MATFQKHLNDWKWLFNENGLMHVWTALNAFAGATTQGTFVAGAGMIGAIEMDAASNPGLTAAQEELVHPSGQLDLVQSTNLEYGSGAVPRRVPVLSR